MRLWLLIISFFFLNSISIAQFTYKGQVKSSITQTAIGFGEIRLPSQKFRERRGVVIGKIDSLGYFNFTLPDTSNVWVIIDCSLAGSTKQRMKYVDTLVTILIKSDCHVYNQQKAILDIEKKTPYLLCSLGYSSYQFNSIDSLFEKKYGVEYYSFGDEPIPNDCMLLYNIKIAEYLDIKFGDIWRKEVRWDAPFK